MEQRLFEAIKAGNLEEVMRLAADNPDLLTARDPNGASPVLVAIYNQKPAIAEALADLRPLDLYEASALGRVDRIHELLQHSPAAASTHAPDGFTPVALAAFFGRVDAVRVLIAAGADVNAPAKNAFKVQALHAAVAGRNMDIVHAVLEAGADPNSPQQAGFRPIHEAANSNNRTLAELLMSHGADPALPNDVGVTALDLARDAGHAELAEAMRAARR